jgi:hypothetical protein
MDFCWHFGSCNHCAMGLASRLWSVSHPVVADAIGIPFDVGQQIFIYLRGENSSSAHDVTPEMVADAIDAYLAKNP